MNKHRLVDPVLRIPIRAQFYKRDIFYGARKPGETDKWM